MKYFFMLIIKAYQKFISPLKPPRCRFYPTCSNYSLEAFSRHGAIKGLYLTVRRILRCNPFCRGGIDYVPTEFYFFKKKTK